MFERITIIGLGLIGGSIARAAHARKLAHTIVAYDRNEVSLAYARKEGFVDETKSNMAAAVTNSSFIIIATPPSTLADVARAIAPRLSKSAIVMDVCSVKQSAVNAIAPHLPEGVEFIPAHPIAGSEQTGVKAGRADLFEHKQVIVTPEVPQQSDAFNAVTNFWKAMGAQVEAMPAHVHDAIYAYMSHLPHLLAFAFPTIPDDEKDDTLRRFLRLCDSSPSLWLEIFMLNKDNILKALDRYLDAIMHIRQELAATPENHSGKSDDTFARTTLFPRIAASCLITTVMEAEKRSGFSFARYAGTGFTDFTCPATITPETDIEKISNEHWLLLPILDEYRDKLQAWRSAIEEDDVDIQ